MSRMEKLFTLLNDGRVKIHTSYFSCNFLNPSIAPGISSNFRICQDKNIVITLGERAI